MKTTSKLFLLLAGAAASAAPLAAQNTYSGYFLDNYNYRFQMNPAYGNETSFVGFPALGNVNIGMQGNLHAKNVLFNVDGKTCLFTNPGVSVKEVMDGIHDKNRIGANVKLNVLNGGFKAWGGYNTVSISAVANAEASVPGTLFSLLKEGISNNEYDIKNLRAHAQGYAEIAFNHSREITQVPGLRAGAAVKFLIGVANVDAYFNDARLVLGENSWDITAQADLYASVKGLKYDHEYNDDVTPRREYVSGANLDNFGALNGFGMAFDLGATYDWNEWKFSAAILDLGFISWSETQYATTGGVVNVQTSKYEFDAVGDDDEGTFDQLKGDLSAIYQLQDRGNIGSRTNALAATLNFGAEYEFPYYKPLHFGLLNSTRIDGHYTWTQFRLSANVRPVSIFSASANVAVGTFGWGFGWLLNLNLQKGFNFFIGMDHTLGKLAKQGLPLNSNAKVNLGIDFPF